MFADQATCAAVYWHDRGVVVTTHRVCSQVEVLVGAKATARVGDDMSLAQAIVDDATLVFVATELSSSTVLYKELGGVCDVDQGQHCIVVYGIGASKLWDLLICLCTQDGRVFVHREVQLAL